MNIKRLMDLGAIGACAIASSCRCAASVPHQRPHLQGKKPIAGKKGIVTVLTNPD